MDKLTTSKQVELNEQPDEQDAHPINWERAFMFLMAMTCQGFISSREMEQRVQSMQKIDPRVAKRMVEFFNTTRTKWMQNFMG